MGFQKTVNQQPAPAVPGDFAGTNPRASVVAPPNGYVAAPDYPSSLGGALREALIVGRFAWFNYATGLAANYLTQNSLIGFVHREVQTIITTFLGEQRMGVQQGFPVTGCSQGDFWADFSASAPDAAGLSVYADPVTGIATAGAPGASVTVTGFTAAVSTAGVMTVAGAGSGAFAVGQLVVVPGLPAGTFIQSLGSGTGGTGTYNLSQAPAVAIGAGATLTAYGVQETRFKLATPVAGTVALTGVIAAGGVLTASAVSGGSLAPGERLVGASIPAWALILGQTGGTPGGAGTYQTNYFVAVTSEAMTATQGKLGKISTWQA